jgi:hypothetical protein
VLEEKKGENHRASHKRDRSICVSVAVFELAAILCE